jgi:phosphatidylinositol kinase/protein kinase (PI-3  family)
MKIMRDNQESIEAVFSSFVHDPLIQHLVLNPRQLIEEVQTPRSELADEVAQIGTPETHLHTRRRKNTSAGEETVTSLSPRAQRVVQRVKQKLEGLEFGTPEPISVEEQVSVLIS